MCVFICTRCVRNKDNNNYNCIIILLSVTVFVCHDKGNVFFCTINSPVYVYWKQGQRTYLYCSQ